MERLKKESQKYRYLLEQVKIVIMSVALLYFIVI